MPFEKFSKDVQQYQTPGTVPEAAEFDRHYHQKDADNTSGSDDLSFERPILIESDSDEIEEE